MPEDSETVATAGESSSRLRRLAYLLIVLVVVGGALGRTARVQSKRGGTPFLSANDRSRWCTIRSLVDLGTYEIDRVIFRSDGKRDPEWHTIDLVRHRARDGHDHYYSSKPPLLPTLIAGEYWVLKRIIGASLAGQPHYLGRAIIVLTNVLPFLLYLAILVRLAERYLKSDWARLFVVTAGAAGTFLSTFLITINNHLPAAFAAMVTLDALLRITQEQDGRWRWYACAGLAASFTAANELPALSFLALVAVVLLVQSPRRWFLGFLPAASLIGALFFATNYAAHGQWRPAYGQRSEGKLVAKLPATTAEGLAPGVVPSGLRDELGAAGVSISDAATLAPLAGDRLTTDPRWVLADSSLPGRLVLVARNGVTEIREWNNWYDFEGSYWTRTVRDGVDAGEVSRARYAFHVLVGHHGIFSLTPLWCLTAFGLLAGLGRREPLRLVLAMTLLLSVVCITFYLMRPLQDRNYGGVASGFRWVFWFSPLWLVSMFPALERLSEWRWGRGLAYALLLVSIFSATYASTNPWSHPWMYDYWTYLGW